MDLFPTDFKLPSTLKTHFRAVGCNACYHTGYQGRRAIYEILPLQKALSAHIKQNALEIDDYITGHNIKTLKDNAVQLITQGVTSIDEVYTLLSS